MLIKSTDTGLQVVTSSAGKVEWYVDYADVDGAGNVTVSRVNSVTAGIATATTTTILGPPASGSVRKILSLRVGNSHATVAQNPLTLQINDGTNVTQWDAINVAASEAITYADGGRLTILDSLGREKLQSALLTPGFGLSGTANAVDTYFGGFPAAGRIGQYSAVHWEIAVSKTAAGTAAPVFTFRTGTAGGTGDTSRVALTSAFAQTGVIDQGVIKAFAVVRTYGASTSGILVCGYRLEHALATTGLAVQPAYGQSGVSSGFDLTTAGLIVGLTINPGSLGVWTFDTAGFATNLIA